MIMMLLEMPRSLTRSHACGKRKMDKTEKDAEMIVLMMAFR